MMAEKKQLLSQHVFLPVVPEVVLGPCVAVFAYLKNVLSATEGEDRAAHSRACEVFPCTCSKLRSPLADVSNPPSILAF